MNAPEIDVDLDRLTRGEAGVRVDVRDDVGWRAVER